MRRGSGRQLRYAGEHYTVTQKGETPGRWVSRRVVQRISGFSITSRIEVGFDRFICHATDCFLYMNHIFSVLSYEVRYYLVLTAYAYIYP